VGDRARARVCGQGGGAAGCGALGCVRAAEQGHAGDMEPQSPAAGGSVPRWPGWRWCGGHCMVGSRPTKGPLYARVPAHEGATVC